MNSAIIGLGSNINPEQNIEKARQLLAQEFKIIAESKFVRTKPIGYTDQADFINGSVHIQADLNLDELKKTLKNFEITLGRTKSSIKSGPRSIDLDIVVWNEKIIDNDFYERDFLKESVLELLPALNY